MIDAGIKLHIVLTNAYTLFCLILGVWALYNFIRDRGLDGQYWGAVAVQSMLAVAIFVLTVFLALGGKTPARWVYWLYLVYFMIVLPATYALLKGRDDRVAAGIFAAVCLFTFLATLTRADLIYNTQLAG